jgi:hypothetical protein
MGAFLWAFENIWLLAHSCQYVEDKCNSEAFCEVVAVGLGF